MDFSKIVPIFAIETNRINMKLENQKCKSLALLEIIQMCMLDEKVSSVSSEKHGFVLSGGPFVVAEIGYPDLMTMKIPLTIVWLSGKKEKKDSEFRLFPMNFQKAIARVVFVSLGGNEEDFEPFFKREYRYWLTA